MKTIFVLAILAVGCSTPEKRYPPVAGCDGSCETTAMPGSSESTSTGGGAVCDAYIGCMKQCDEGDCVALCAAATSVDGEQCEQVRCDALVDACSQQDEQACADLLGCVPSSSLDSTSTSRGSDESSSTSSSSTESTSSSSSSDSSSSDTTGTTDGTSTSDGSSSTGTSGESSSSGAT